MDWRLWFSFSGRINRGKYWLVTLINAVISGICITILGAKFSGLQMGMYGDAAGGVMALIGVLTLILIVILVSSLAIAWKRLHDRNKSAVWLLLFFVAPAVLNAIGQSIGSGAGAFVALVGAAIALWGFVEIACLKGTTGPNDFGPDPIPA